MHRLDFKQVAGCDACDICDESKKNNNKIMEKLYQEKIIKTKLIALLREAKTTISCSLI